MSKPSQNSKLSGSEPKSTDTGLSSRLKIVRQERIDTHTGEQCIIEVNGKIYDVANYSPFGLAVFGDAQLKNLKSLDNIPLIFEGTEIARLTLSKVREEQMPNATYKIAFEITSAPLNIEKFQAIRKAHEVTAAYERDKIDESQVPSNFKYKTLEIKDRIEDLHSRLTQLEERISGTSLTEIQTIEETVVQVISKFLKGELEPVVHSLSKDLRDCDSPAVKASYSYFRNKLGKYLYRSPFSERSYTKPLGYAGDFEMMNMVYREENLGRGLFAKCLHRYMVGMPGGDAVRNRAVYLKEKLVHALKSRKSGEVIRVMSVASGPAMELQMLIKDKSLDIDLSKVEFYLLDQDLSSLRHAQKQLRELGWENDRTMNVILTNKSIRNIIMEGNGTNAYHLIYSAGLFDYFSDPVAHVAAKRLTDSLTPGGQLIIGNFDVSNPSRFFMELAWDWSLVHRSETDLSNLFATLGSKLVVEKEASGINLFCLITK